MIGASLPLVLPWLWPLTSGPTAAVEPYLVSAACAALVLALWPTHDVQRATRLTAWSWLAAAQISSLIALLQYFDLETPLFPWVNIADPGQAFGNLRQPNQLASLLVIGALALRWLVQDGRLALRYAAWMGALMMAALAATASRVGLVELLVCGGLVLWWALSSREHGRGRRALTVVSGAVALYVLAAVALPLLAQTTEGIAGRDMLDRLQHAESTCGSRLILWRNVLDLIAARPWTGWGWGELDYAHYIHLYDGPRFCHILDNAHNLPLHLAVELGVPVALLVCGLIAWLVWRGRPWAEQQPARQLAWGVLLVIGIHSMVEYPLWYGPFQIAAVICVWLLWATREGANTGPTAADEQGSPPSAFSAVRVGIAAGMLAVVAYAGWDYHRISQVFLSAGERSAAYRDDAMGHAKRSWLYGDVVRFAEVTSRPATRDNADWMLPNAQLTLHFSPEPRVIIKAIESASFLGQDELAMAHLVRFKAAFPREHAEWMADNERQLQRARAELKRASAASDGR